MTTADARRSDTLRTLDAVSERAVGHMSGENFPVALRVLPASVRADLTRVYAFARFVDDVGDETTGGADDRLSLLDVVDCDVQRLPGPDARLAVVASLAPLVTRTGMPVQVLRDLVEANRVDQRTPTYETFEDLLGYCALSAAPVGRAVLYVAGAATAENVSDSDAVCAALQVLEHCQDVGEDAAAGRIYLPAADRRAAGAENAPLSPGPTPPALRRTVQLQVERSRELLRAGRPLVGRLSGWARIAVAGYVAGGLATADALDAAGYDVLARDVRPSKARTAKHAVRLLVGR